MNNNEYDTRAVAKTNAEYITPQALRQFLAQKITKNNITVLEPAIGSGQLLFELRDKITEIDGFDVNKSSIDTPPKLATRPISLNDNIISATLFCFSNLLH